MAVDQVLNDRIVNRPKHEKRSAFCRAVLALRDEAAHQAAKEGRAIGNVQKVVELRSDVSWVQFNEQHAMRVDEGAEHVYVFQRTHGAEGTEGDNVSQVRKAFFCHLRAGRHRRRRVRAIGRAAE